MVFKLIPLAVGLWFAYAGLSSLALAAFGTRADALVDETTVKAVKEVPDPEGGPPSYVVRARISYHFEACPEQGSPEPCAKAEGKDTMILRAPYAVLSHDKGYGAPVLYLRAAPGVNAAAQPRHLVVYGLLELLLGLGLAAFEIRVMLRDRRARLAAAGASAPVPAPADPWHELGRPLDSERRRPDDDIQPS